MNPNPRIARQEGVVRRLKMFAEESRNIKSDDAYSDLINRLYTFLMSNGYTDRNLLPLKNALHHHNENKNYNLVEDCILSLAKDIECAGLPLSTNTSSESPAITISNTNHQETAISLDLVHDALADELTSDQMVKLKELLSKKQRGDLNYKITQKGVIFYKHLIYSRRILLKYSTVGIICDFIDA